VPVPATSSFYCATVAPLSPFAPPLPLPSQIKASYIKAPVEELRMTSLRPDGFYYHVRSNTLYIPPSVRDAFLYWFHASPTGGHRGVVATTRRMKKFVWWPSLHKSVEKYVNACLPCQRNANPVRSTLLSVLQRPVMSDLISVDYVGPLSASISHHVLVIIDHATRFIVTAVAPSATADFAVKTLKERWIPIFAAPRAILTDRGSHFTAHTFVNYVTKTLAAHHLLTSPYYPQGNAINERSHGVLNHSIKIALQTVAFDPRYIESAVSDATLAYNATYHSALGDCPYFRTFAKDPILPGFQDFAKSTSE